MNNWNALSETERQTYITHASYLIEQKLAAKEETNASALAQKLFEGGCQFLQEDDDLTNIM